MQYSTNSVYFAFIQNDPFINIKSRFHHLSLCHCQSYLLTDYSSVYQSGV